MLGLITDAAIQPPRASAARFGSWLEDHADFFAINRQNVQIGKATALLLFPVKFGARFHCVKIISEMAGGVNSLFAHQKQTATFPPQAVHYSTVPCIAPKLGLPAHQCSNSFDCGDRGLEIWQCKPVKMRHINVRQIGAAASEFVGTVKLLFRHTHILQESAATVNSKMIKSCWPQKIRTALQPCGYMLNQVGLHTRKTIIGGVVDIGVVAPIQVSLDLFSTFLMFYFLMEYLLMAWEEKN